MKFKRGKVVGFKVGVYGAAIGNTRERPATNTCVFATRSEANRAGVELLSRWLGPEGFRVIEQTKELPNYVFPHHDHRPRAMTVVEQAAVQTALAAHRAGELVEDGRQRRQVVAELADRVNSAAAAHTVDDLRDMMFVDLVRVITKDWDNVYYAARPYLDAMRHMDSVDTPCMHDDGRSVVRYFLANAGHWRGGVAKAVKNELRRRIGPG